MKTIPVLLLEHYETGSTTVAYALLLSRTDGETLALTSHDADVELLGTTYSSEQGLDITSVAQTAGMAVDNLELTTLDDGTVFTRSDVLGGVWNSSDFVLRRFNWARPQDGAEVMITGVTGDFKLKRGMIVAELRGLTQYLQQPIGHVSTRACRARLGDSMCKVDLGPFTVAGTLTSVDSKQVFRDSARTEDEDWFAEGILTWTGGLNDGLTMRVKSNTYYGTFTLVFPMLLNVAVGDTYSVHAGCQKRLQEDCRDKFNNVLNYQGEPHRPGPDAIIASPEASA